MDNDLVLSGILLLVYAAIFVAIYLLVEKGTLLDPVTISWLGYSVFVAGGMICVGMFLPHRMTGSVSVTAYGCVYLGTLSYTLGLYTGKGRLLSRVIPTVSPTLTKLQIWSIWSVCAIFVAGGVTQFRFIPEALAKVAGGVVDGSVGALILISLLVILTYRGSPFSKAFMVITLFSAFTFVFFFYFSRRPLIGVLLASMAFYYRQRWSHRSLAARAILMSSILFGAITLLLFLTASRGSRFYAAAAVRGSNPIFSAENWKSTLDGITINYLVYEYTMAAFPNERNYLYGSGMLPAALFFVPRSLWPDKPWSSGWVITTMWFRTGSPNCNVPNLILGELYMNFSYIGLVAGMFLIGRIVRGINTYLRENSNNNVLWLVWLLVTPDFVGEWRGDLTSMTAQGVLRVSLFLGIAWLVNKFSVSEPFVMEDVPALSQERGGAYPLPDYNTYSAYR